MRKSSDTLSALVSNAMGLDLLTGDLFLFESKDRKIASEPRCCTSTARSCACLPNVSTKGSLLPSGSDITPAKS